MEHKRWSLLGMVLNFAILNQIIQIVDILVWILVCAIYIDYTILNYSDDAEHSSLDISGSIKVSLNETKQKIVER